MFIIGIDPGKSGAAAFIEDGQLTVVRKFDSNIDRCRNLASCSPDAFFIERVTASPQMGVVSAFTFGKWAESVECAAVVSGAPLYMVRPQV